MGMSQRPEKRVALKRRHPSRDRKTGRGTWQEFTKFLLETYVSSRSGQYEIPALRGFLYEHQVIGLHARRAYWKNLRQHVRVEQGENRAEIVASQTLLPTRIKYAIPGSSRVRLMKFIELWSPGGALRVTMDEINAIEEFQAWRRRRTSR
jgi:hypothetical protein